VLINMFKLKLIGFDSMGSRGMATVVDVMGLKIFIDPGVSYAPLRYGLPPHPVELEAFEKHLEAIKNEMNDTDIVIISHYHRDHYLYRDGEEEYYRGKTLFIKDPFHYINYSQKIRAYRLLNKQNVKNLVKRLEVVDGREFDYGFIKFTFSPPLPHGVDGSPLGSVVLTTIVFNDYKLMHASDVQGPMSDNALNNILSVNPDILIISGPPTYFEGFKIESRYVNKALNNLAVLANSLKPGSIIIVDHHLLRDLNYMDRIRDVYSIANLRKVKIMTAAEYMGYEIRQLEALRKTLWSRSQ